MKRLLSAAIFSLFALSASAAVHRPRSLEDVLGNPGLIGHRIDVVACAGVPLSDAPSQKNLILVFPCGASASDMDESEAVIGRLTKATVFKPAAGWQMGDSPLFNGRFRGVLRKGTLPGRGMHNMLVIDLDEVDFHASLDPE
ncbi:hypothetical protein [Dyella sp. A6]|uniref:hypothetical protein n=1 Tax=Dyella aluminiiresistens TaxID=3069105 RepID=UPI002E7A163C|nr:hypothetical protein [Dyella sp. A6]